MEIAAAWRQRMDLPGYYGNLAGFFYF